ncbi:MarR family transcriptional regulator [Candidatus Micrarchaeota archaeon]|nr:MarR family transcriptional regulator [Candidatus Micrarchaeota archaeon]
MVDVFSGKSGRVVMYLLLNSRKQVSQKQIVEATGLSKGLVSRIVSVLSAKGLVKRPYRTRFVLEYPGKLLLDWIGNRNLALKKAFFAKDGRVLEKIPHAHTLLSGAWLDSGYLKSDFRTVYVKPGLKAGGLVEGKAGELKSKIVLIEADDDFVFYGKRKLKGENVVNPFLLYVDMASFGGLASSALGEVAEKHGFPKLSFNSGWGNG